MITLRIKKFKIQTVLTIIIFSVFGLTAWDCENENGANLLDAPLGIINDVDDGAYTMGSADIVDTFAAPSSSSYGIAYNAGKLYIENEDSRTIHVYSTTTLSQTTSFQTDPLSNYWTSVEAFGLTIRYGILYYMTVGDSLIHEWDLATSTSLGYETLDEDSIGYYNGWISGIAFINENDVFIAKTGTSVLLKFNYGGGYEIERKEYNSGNLEKIRGICTDSTNTYLYVCDSGKNRILKIEVSSLLIVKAYDLSYCPYGIAYDGTYFYITTYDNGDVILKAVLN